jgi:hypothetical protein
MPKGYRNTIESIQDRLIPEDLGHETLCRVWSGAFNKRNGYGKVRYDGVYHRPHRLLYVTLVAEIPDGFEPDHLCHEPDRCAGGPTCRHRLCANLDHIKVVTRLENFMRSGAPAARNARKTHCDSGHLFSGANVRYYINSRGGISRYCVQCGLDYSNANRISDRDNSLARVGSGHRVGSLHPMAG